MVINDSSVFTTLYCCLDIKLITSFVPRKQMALFRQYERDLFLVLKSMEEEEEGMDMDR